DEPRAAVPGTGDEYRVEVPLEDRAVHVRVEQVHAGRGAPAPEQPRLDVLEGQGLAQERIVEQVDLPDGEVVRRPPPAVEATQLFRGKPRVMALWGDGCVKHPGDATPAQRGAHPGFTTTDPWSLAVAGEVGGAHD